MFVNMVRHDLRKMLTQNRVMCLLYRHRRSFSTKRPADPDVLLTSKDVTIGGLRKRRAEEFMKNLDIAMRQKKRRIEFMIENIKADGGKVKQYCIVKGVNSLFCIN